MDADGPILNSTHWYNFQKCGRFPFDSRIFQNYTDVRPSNDLNKVSMDGNGPIRNSAWLIFDGLTFRAQNFEVF